MSLNSNISSRISTSKSSKRRQRKRSERKIRNTTGETLWSPSLPLSSISEAYCVLFSLSGYMHAREYDELYGEGEDNATIHNDEQVEAIVSAMEVHELERGSFWKALQRLDGVLFRVETKDEKGYNEGFYNEHQYQNHLRDMKHFQRVESACEHLRQVLTSYQRCLSHQRFELARYHSLLSQILTSKTSSSSSSSRTSITNAETAATVAPLLVMYRALSLQYKHQLHLEASIIRELILLLNHDAALIYSSSTYTVPGTEDSDTNNNNSSNNNKRNTDVIPHLNDALTSWAEAIRNRMALDENFWIGALAKFQTLTKPSHPVEMEECDHQSELPFHPVTATDARISSPTLSSVPRPVRSVHDQVLSCETIEDVLSIFLKDDGYAGPSRECRGDIHYGAHDVNNDGYGSDGNDNSSRHSFASGGEALFLLVVGPSGSGKTHLCDDIRKRAKRANPDDKCSITVISPRLPVDFLVNHVGGSEDRLLSLFTYAQQITLSGRNCLILLDDVQHILGDATSSNTSPIDSSSDLGMAGNETHLTLRVRTMFLSIVDRLKMDCSSSISRSSNSSSYYNAKPHSVGNLMVICTTRSPGDSYADRFDKLFCLREPNPRERRDIIQQCLALNTNAMDENGRVQHLLDTIVDCTVGRSVGEISQYCRQALVDTSHFPSNYHGGSEDDNAKEVSVRQEDVLSRIKQSLQTIPPESIKSGIYSEFVDMNVSTSKDLRENVTLDKNGKEILPLLGTNAQECWKQLERTILTPLCRSTILDDLLYGGGTTTRNVDTDRKSTRCGILLSGSPGSGKTTLAYHCAAVAAGIDPSIRLLDVSCTSLIRKEVGASERAVQKLFESARAAVPCILLLDGVENLAPPRGNDNTTEGTMDRLLSTLLTEMDGVVPGNKQSSSSLGGVAVIGITHNPDWIDPALRRPGRLEKCVLLGHPDLEARKEILQREIQSMDIDLTHASFFDPKNKEELIEALAMRTSHKSAAEVIAVCNEARMLSLQEAMENISVSGCDSNIKDCGKIKIRHTFFSHFSEL